MVLRVGPGLGLALGLAALSLSSACSRPSPDPSSEAPAAAPQEERPLVLTTFTVLADMARNVAGDQLEVRSITKQGAEIHGYQPTPSDVEQASGADLILENGLGLELWARKFTAAAGDVPTVTLSEGMEPLLIADDAYAGKPNPHAWMSPRRAMAYVDRMVEAFSELDPAGAEAFAANGATYKKQLQDLDDELRESLAQLPESRRVLVSCEGAFTYLTTDYGMEEAYLWPVNAESQVTPQRMARLIDLVRERQLPAVFCESTVSSEAQEEVARASGSRFAGTFYVDSLSESDGPAPTLLDLQRHNVRLIQQGLMPGAAQDS
ncbi:metal ABC transporter substrate-binding protein [Synechococcus sp. RSCCF101]|uniref:metal ABC transporter substrate-binding protein n=1 Tax=Synechococcus sp. RSCCF101 TaxID=2511069 RepID=UPI00124472C5|nr:metal ABC transporter substrate-binding protein [Synechococcus sp. RSCCF101]QEY31433.1 metal ABC transporter substrate-binding protein [Synechococcus sp. RSCCF101]